MLGGQQPLLFQANIFSLLFLHMRQLAVQTEVVLFTVEWGITTKSLKAISNSVRLIGIKGDYNISFLSCYVQAFFKRMLFPLFPVTATKKHRDR